jgi:hypothetical protein
MDLQLRKTVISVEEILHDNGPVPDRPLKVGWGAIVLKNPYADAYEPDIQGMMEVLKPFGLELAQKLIDALGGDPSEIEGYGKGALVGEAGELEHGALWHVPGGYAMRELLGDALAIVPSSKKLAALGARLDIPITHVNAAYVRSHFSAQEISIPDAPRRDELIYALVMTTGPRIHHRVGGLKASEIKQMDGLR